jgi:hypothetical protein
MVFSQEQRPRRGQEFRDRVRCQALDDRGYRVYTMDDKHSVESAYEGRHCTANFADKNRMLKTMNSTWGTDFGFDLIVLDYFFSPAGWANVRWSEPFFSKTLPAFVTENRLSKEGSLWLPHIGHVEEMIQKYEKDLSKHYQWRLVSQPASNPLYAATDTVEGDLQRTPDWMTNESQFKYQLAEPFYEFKRIVAAPVVRPVMSPMANKTAISRASPSYSGRKILAKKAPISQKIGKSPTRVMPKRNCSSGARALFA